MDEEEKLVEGGWWRVRSGLTRGKRKKEKERKNKRGEEDARELSDESGIP